LRGTPHDEWPEPEEPIDPRHEPPPFLPNGGGEDNLYPDTIVRFVAPSVGALCFIWMAVEALLTWRESRVWQAKAKFLMSLCGISVCGLFVYTRLAGHAGGLYYIKGVLSGMTLGMFIVLWMEGTIPWFGKLRRSARK
jgi:hypothetical protein